MGPPLRPLAIVLMGSRAGCAAFSPAHVPGPQAVEIGRLPPADVAAQIVGYQQIQRYRA
jgi:hypothetical protein